MEPFSLEDILDIEELLGDKVALTARIGQMIKSSTKMRVYVESLRTETGEYRIVIQGMIDQPEPVLQVLKGSSSRGTPEGLE